tara:strand:+ start:1310 stop:2191 length:882 start_codon:yes stop_codon:yes gene_type:complete
VDFDKSSVNIDGQKLAYIDVGEGTPIVMLHGNPTSSFLWRNIIPHLNDLGRVIVPDLIGHGDSDKLPVSMGPDRYTFENTFEYIDKLLNKLEINQDITLILHDWGSALGFYWAMKNPEKIKAICYMEAIVSPINWSDWPEQARGIFKGFRSAKGEDLILKRNMFIEAVLPSSIIRKLTKDEMDEYRKPFLNENDRQVTLNWPRQIPIEGEPSHMFRLVTSYAEWISNDGDIPKLFINADPGSILIGNQREFCRGWKNQTEVTVNGLHFIQEDSPHEIGEAISSWMRNINVAHL